MEILEWKHRVALNAHTDFRGNDNYNLKRSDRGAALAMRYLISKWISEEHLTWKGYGESMPLIDCEPCTEVQHEQNRRIEFIILEDKVAILFSEDPNNNPDGFLSGFLVL